MTDLDAKLAEIAAQYDDLQADLARPEVTADPNELRRLGRELARLEPKPRRAVLAAADALTQIETLDVYRHQRRFSGSETRELLSVALRALLTRKY